MKVEISEETYMNCKKSFEAREIQVLEGFGSSYYVTELHHYYSRRDGDRFYADVELVKIRNGEK